MHNFGHNFNCVESIGQIYLLFKFSHMIKDYQFC